MKKITMALVAGMLVAGSWGVAVAQGSDDDVNLEDARVCRLKTLHGSYLFAASGFNIVGGVAVPKAIHEVIDFNGDGTLTVPAVSLSVNGVISRSGGGVGDYAVDERCIGTLVFTGGPSFDIVAAPNGDTVWMFQTNPNTVFQGTATRLTR